MSSYNCWPTTNKQLTVYREYANNEMRIPISIWCETVQVYVDDTYNAIPLMLATHGKYYVSDIVITKKRATNTHEFHICKERFRRAWRHGTHNVYTVECCSWNKENSNQCIALPITQEKTSSVFPCIRMGLEYALAWCTSSHARRWPLLAFRLTHCALPLPYSTLI
jgi:hypothetical protein